MTNKEVIGQFYTAFAHADAEGMIRCYADDIVFEDPAFGKLEGNDARVMWRMLVQPGGLKLEFGQVWAEGDQGGAHWEARYRFSKTGREVLNKIDATFVFRDGKIIRHTDHFSFHKWASQALGLPGLLLGWTPFLQKKVRTQALERLQAFKNKTR